MPHVCQSKLQSGCWGCLAAAAARLGSISGGRALGVHGLIIALRLSHECYQRPMKAHAGLPFRTCLEGPATDS